MSRANKEFDPDLLQRPTASCICFKSKVDDSHIKNSHPDPPKGFAEETALGQYTSSINRLLLYLG